MSFYFHAYILPTLHRLLNTSVQRLEIRLAPYQVAVVVQPHEDAAAGVFQRVAWMDHDAREMGYVLKERHLAFKLVRPSHREHVAAARDGGFTRHLFLLAPVYRT